MRVKLWREEDVEYMRGWFGRLVTQEVKRYYDARPTVYNMGVWEPISRAGWRRGFAVGALAGAALALAAAAALTAPYLFP